MPAIQRAFLTPGAVRDLRQMKVDVARLLRPGRKPERRRVLGGGGAVLIIDDAILRTVNEDDNTLTVTRVKRTAPLEIEIVEDDDGQEVTEEVWADIGVPIQWYKQFIWPGNPDFRTPFIKVTKDASGNRVAWQWLKHALIDPPDPRQFAPGLCGLLGG